MWKVQAVDRLLWKLRRRMGIVMDGLVVVDERTGQTGASEPCGEGGKGGYYCPPVPRTVPPIRDRRPIWTCLYQLKKNMRCVAIR